MVSDLIPLGTGVFFGFVLALCLHDYIDKLIGEKK